jgi:hypothetical protein
MTSSRFWQQQCRLLVPLLLLAVLQQSCHALASDYDQEHLEGMYQLRLCWQECIIAAVASHTGIAMTGPGPCKQDVPASSLQDLITE